MINTGNHREHALWGQIVGKESEARKRFEYLTGETSAKKFFNGTLKRDVDTKLQTFDAQFRSIQQKKPSGGDDMKSNAGSNVSKNRRQSKQLASTKGRYSSASKADILSRALGEVIG